MEAQRFLNFDFFSFSRAVWTWLFLYVPQRQVSLGTQGGWSFPACLWHGLSLCVQWQDRPFPVRVGTLSDASGGWPWQCQAGMALWNLHGFGRWRWPNMFAVDWTSCLTGKAKLLCNLGWIHVGRFSGLKCSLLLLKLSCRYFVVFCAFLKCRALDLGLFHADNNQIVFKNSITEVNFPEYWPSIVRLCSSVK